MFAYIVRNSEICIELLEYLLPGQKINKVEFFQMNDKEQEGSAEGTEAGNAEGHRRGVQQARCSPGRLPGRWYNDLQHRDANHLTAHSFPAVTAVSGSSGHPPASARSAVRRAAAQLCDIHLSRSSWMMTVHPRRHQPAIRTAAYFTKENTGSALLMGPYGLREAGLCTGGRGNSRQCP